jgi:ABC-type bacteriocin/lantibiotic exporter with double-glycine peptidase domain
MVYIVGVVQAYILLPNIATLPVIFSAIGLILNVIFGKIYGNIQKKFMHAKDLRMRGLDEMISGIKTIKYNSMEDFFRERVSLYKY